MEMTSYDWFLDAIKRCGTYLLSADEDTVGYQMFEEFDVGAGTFYIIIH
jgi:hypothetical protein